MKPTIKKKPTPPQTSLFNSNEGYDNKMLGVGAAEILREMKVKPKIYKLYKK